MKQVITCVNLNAAIDRTYYLPAFEAGGVWRVQRILARAGGKGTNVARTLRRLGVDSRVVGFAGGRNGAAIRAELDREGIGHDLVEVGGESRVCLNIVSSENGRSTELLEPGPAVTAAQLAGLRRVLQETAAASALVVFSGSLPQGLPTDTYRMLIEDVQAAGARAVLDTSGEPLREGLKARPYLAKPNGDELDALAGARAAGVPERWGQLRALQAAGAVQAVVTLGADGALAVDADDGPFRVYAPAIRPVSTVGCGDAFTAGIAAALSQGAGMDEALRRAAAAGAANALTETAGDVDPAAFTALLAETRAEVL